MVWGLTVNQRGTKKAGNDLMQALGSSIEAELRRSDQLDVDSRKL